MSVTTKADLFPHVVTLAGVEVRFAEFEEGTRPATDLDDRAELAAASLAGDKGDYRLLRLVWGVQTGVEAGVVHPEHLEAISAACGGDKPVKVSVGDEKVSRRVAPFLSTQAAIAATWWVLSHEPTWFHYVDHGSLACTCAMFPDDEEATEAMAAALGRSLEEAPK